MGNNKIILVSKSTSRDYVIFHNQTSKQDFIDYKFIKITQLDKKSISVVLPKGKCAVGHTLTLFVFDSDQQLKKLSKMPQNKSILKYQISISGKVVESENISENAQEVLLDLQEFSLEEWAEYLKKYEWKQQKSNYIIDKYRI